MRRERAYTVLVCLGLLSGIAFGCGEHDKQEGVESTIETETDPESSSFAQMMGRADSLEDAGAYSEAASQLWLVETEYPESLPAEEVMRRAARLDSIAQAKEIQEREERLASREPSREPQTVELSEECEEAFRRAAAVDDMHDTHADLFPAYSVCRSLDEWRMANSRYPNAMDAIGDPVDYALNVCRGNADRIGRTTICRLIGD